MHPMLNIAVKAARRAGQIINRASFELDTIEVTTKHSRDFVTNIDRAAEAAIIEIIKSHYPSHGILAEESGQADADAEYQWIIDPLDGTTNFIHGIPHYAVSIALARRGTLTQAVVFDPNRNEMFTASRGVGAYLNDRRMRVTVQDDLGRSVIGTGFPFRAQTDYARYFQVFHEMTELVAGMRRPGAAALDLAWVGCGRFDGFFEMGLKPWDAAAGALLVMEAGGLISDWLGDQDYLGNGDVLAATPKIYTQLLRHTRKAHGTAQMPQA